MAIRIVRYRESTVENDVTNWGKLVSASPTAPDDTLELLPLQTQAQTSTALIEEFDSADGLKEGSEPVSISASQLLSPVTKNVNIVCQGLNYASHASESGHQTRKANLFFSKASSSICGPYDDIVRPAGVELLDYEAEIGVVLRKDITVGAQVSHNNIGDYVAGFVLANDVSARDTMFGAGFFQWFQGKSYRTFCPLGPVLYLLEAAEVAAVIDELELSLDYQGETKQSALSSLQLYKPAETLTQLGEFMDVNAGDLLLTGTPGGVLAHGTPPVVQILKDFIVKDAERREKLVEEFKSHHPFLQPGETLSLTLKDLANDIHLGAQKSTVVAN